MDPLYREIILEHWENPLNYGVISGADVDVLDLNPLCGDEMRVMMRIVDGKVAEIGFVALGCAISKASGSLFTERVKGMDLEDVMKITEEDVLGDLGVELTPARMKCALLVWKVVRIGLKI